MRVECHKIEVGSNEPIELEGFNAALPWYVMVLSVSIDYNGHSYVVGVYRRRALTYILSQGNRLDDWFTAFCKYIVHDTE